MKKQYKIELDDNECVSISEHNSSVLVFKIPYQVLKEHKNRQEMLKINNNFIVYILQNKGISNPDTIYVGKSKNGISVRPMSHENSDIEWNYCYILTNKKEQSFLNDGVIQYIENKIHTNIANTNRFDVTTKKSNTDTINDGEKVPCDNFIEEAIKMLYVIGLDIRIPTRPTVKQQSIQINKNETDDKNTTTDMEEIKNKFLQKLQQFNPKITIKTNKSYDNINVDNRTIGSIVMHQTQINFTFATNIENIKDEDKILKEKIPSNLGIGPTETVIKDDKKLDYIVSLYNQVLNL